MKPEPFFLENANWPAFLLEGGTIRRANQAAVNFFGPKLEGDSALLSAIWSEDNELTPDQFLARWERSATAMVPLKFRAKGAAVTSFCTFICSQTRDGVKRFVFQLLRDLPASASPVSPATGQGGYDTRVAQKQKLDCALNLTRTAALDFNNALTSILGHSSLVLSKMETEHPWRESLLEVEKAAERAAEIAHQLGAFGRQEKETRDLPTGNLNPMLRRVVEMFRRAKTKTVNWSVELENKPYAVKFDEAKLTQAFVKIIENAVQAVGETGRVTVRTQNRDVTRPSQEGTALLEPGCYVCVEVADDGCGIPKEVQHRIFEPFFSTKPGHRGLGLAWVYGIITNHGGAVSVSSEPDQGTVVRVYLRALRKPLPERDAAEDETMTTGQERILVVDDEDPILTLAQAILTSRGYQVVTAHSGEEALELFSQMQPPADLVITDVVMPTMSGKELMDQIRLRSPRTPIIYTSGCIPSTPDEEGFLRKPFTSQELLRSIQHAFASATRP